MNTALRSAVLLSVTAFFFASCSGGGGGDTSGGGSGRVPTGNPSVLAKVSAPAPTSQCPTGGITIDTGIDTNLNGLLDTSEIKLTQYVCNGASGTNGTNGSNGPGGISALVSIVSEPSGTNCSNGGNKVSVGPDTDGNGILDAGEIASTKYICNGINGTNGTNGMNGTNGSNGTNGTNGANSLLSITTEPVGASCATGGLKIVSWLDATANGVVDIGETSFTNYICNTPGTVVIQSITATPPVVHPGEATMLVVKATDGAGSPLTYRWSGGSGTFLSATDSFVTTWSSNTIGGDLLQVEVSNGTSTVNGYTSILVSAAPSGPIITNVSPGESYAGGEILISGAGFGAVQGTGTVTIGGVPATAVLSWSDSQVRARVPVGAVTGTVTVTVGGSVSTPGAIVIPWSSADNVPIVTEGSTQQNPRIIADGSGGAIIVWEDLRNDIYYDLYAQRIDRTGAVKWTAGGIVISTAPNDQIAAQLIPDGSGGAIIVWQDRRNFNWDIYAQRVNGAGQVQWGSGGVAVAAAGIFEDQTVPRIAADGNGGAFIVWEDTRGGGVGIYAQRVDANGSPQWTTNGISIASQAAYDEKQPRIVADGSGGAVIVWEDYRGAGALYAQRINGAGQNFWTAGGIAGVAIPIVAASAEIASDGTGGAYIAWTHNNTLNLDVRAQRIGSDGVAQWTPGGMTVAGPAFDQIHPQIISDGSGGAIIAWEDQRGGAALIAYAQRISRAGIAQWGDFGVPLSSVPVNMLKPQLVSDGEGGAIVTWQDQRSDWDIYAQRVNGSGVRQWADEAVAISRAGSFQMAPQMVSDGNGGAIIVWQDLRSGTNYDLYAQGVTTEGAR